MSEEEATYTVRDLMAYIDGFPVKTLEEAEKYISYMEKRSDRADDRANRFLIEMHRWEAKFRQVKHENNELRKQLKRTP